MKLHKPMKPATLFEGALEYMDDDIITFPIYGTPKFDGIRCCIQNGKALTYALKSIPNDYIRNVLSHGFLNGFDGELIVRQSIGDYFNGTQSGVMSKEGKPDFVFHAFDYMPQNKKEEKWGYLRRVDELYSIGMHSQISVVEPVAIWNMKSLIQYEQRCLKDGYEGIILRNGDGIYKYGRSTLREFGMVKYKRFLDAEAKVIGFIELESNKNESIRDAVGRLGRSSKKSGMVKMNMLGAFEMMDTKTKVKFQCGSGLTLKQRKEIWKHKDKYMGSIWTYKYQPRIKVKKPQCPTLKGQRIA